MNINGNADIKEAIELQWYVVHVRSRHEFSVTERLVKSGIEAFLPIVERLRRWKDRKKLLAFPLFPGYLFVNIPKVIKHFFDVCICRFVICRFGYFYCDWHPHDQRRALGTWFRIHSRCLTGLRESVL